MKKENTKALREGAMMVALTVILMLLTKYMPLFSAVGMFVLGIPMALLAVRNGFKATALSLAVLFIVAVMIDGGVVSAVSTILMSVLPCAVAGCMLGKGKKFFAIVFATSAAVCLGWIFELAVIKLFLADGVDDMLAELLQQMKTVMSAAFEGVGDTLLRNSELTADEYIETFAEMFEYILRLYFPSMVVIASTVTAYIMIRLSVFVMRRTKLASVRAVPFSSIKASRGMGTATVLFGVLSMFFSAETVFGAAIKNVVLVMYMLLTVCGLSFADYKLKSKVKAAPLRMLIYGAVMVFGGMLSGIAVNVLIIIGIIDSGRDFRNIGDYSEPLA